MANREITAILTIHGTSASSREAALIQPTWHTNIADTIRALTGDKHLVVDSSLTTTRVFDGGWCASGWFKVYETADDMRDAKNHEDNRYIEDFAPQYKFDLVVHDYTYSASPK
jgi:hypothetical protein